MAPAASTRWCPTPEQLMILEEMYRGGIKTPNASQIQQITAHLSLYGKIEGKNVFYWFQNHKARDRQKLRRKLNRQQQQQQQQILFHQPLLHHQHHLLSPFEASSSIGFPQFHHVNSPHLLPQEGLQEVALSLHQPMNYTWKVENTQMDHHQMENWMKMYGGSGGDWMMMMDMGTPPPPPPPSCRNTNKPLKTLELFPINSTTSLKDECATSSTSKMQHSFSSPQLTK